ncbi:MAG: TRASH domain-containing protein [Candidatus Omnitrophota bacterium]|nr:TRASH domain-containing protein [Candidatus Omnitrophota bacterium]
MVKKTLVLVTLCIFVCGAVFAMCGACGAVDAKAAGKSASAATSVKANNTVCPVTGEKVDMNNPVTVEHEGKIYNLCCAACPSEFKKDPAKYIAKVEAQKK